MVGWLQEVTLYGKEDNRMSNPFMATTIVGTINPSHMAENLVIAQKGVLPTDTYAEAKRRLDQAAGEQGR